MRWQRFLVISASLWAGWFALGFATVSLSLPPGRTPGPYPDPSTLLHPTFLGLLTTNGLVWLVLLAGIVTAGMATAVCLSYNGLELGMSLAYSHHLYGWSWTLRAVLPHGFTEILGLLLAGAVGLTGADVLLRLVRDRPVPWPELWRLLVKSVLVSGGLIILSALVETYVTPLALR